MQLEQIITCANRSVELQFRVMERSLRRTGCSLPLRVIPFDDNTFQLPDGASWEPSNSVFDELSTFQAAGYMRKLSVLTFHNYQFLDCDAIFIHNPVEVLRLASGFIASCGQCMDPEPAINEVSRRELVRASTRWQTRLFNSGQFACDQQLYSIDELITTMRDPIVRTMLAEKHSPFEQPVINLLVARKRPRYTNVTFPPFDMESTWAGDYSDAYEHYWGDSFRKPYVLHWAGRILDQDRPINELFLGFLTCSERIEWDEQQRQEQVRRAEAYRAELPALKQVIYDFKQVARRILRNVGVDAPVGSLKRWSRERVG